MKKHNSKTKMPAMLFYSGDFLKDPAVRCLSLEARGLWIDMICLMYESPVRGFLSLASGKPVTAVLLARMVGGGQEQVERLLEEMNDCGVYSVDENGVVYSRRMVGDEKLREAKSKAGKKGMEKRYSNESLTDPVTDPVTEVQQNGNRPSNKAVTALEDEYEDEVVIETAIDSSSRSELSRRSREKSSPIDFVLGAIPESRLHNPSKTRVQIRRVLDVAIGNGKEESACARLLAERFKLYYQSVEGRGEYFKLPHTWLEDDCHLVDPSVWDSRKKKKETTGWDNALPKGIE